MAPKKRGRDEQDEEGDEIENEEGVGHARAIRDMIIQISKLIFGKVECRFDDSETLSSLKQFRESSAGGGCSWDSAHCVVCVCGSYSIVGCPGTVGPAGSAFAAQNLHQYLGVGAFSNHEARVTLPASLSLTSPVAAPSTTVHVSEQRAAATISFSVFVFGCSRKRARSSNQPSDDDVQESQELFAAVSMTQEAVPRNRTRKIAFCSGSQLESELAVKHSMPQVIAEFY
jgi:hypothetical protein